MSLRYSTGRARARPLRTAIVAAGVGLLLAGTPLTAQEAGGPVRLESGALAEGTLLVGGRPYVAVDDVKRAFAGEFEVMSRSRAEEKGIIILTGREERKGPRRAVATPPATKSPAAESPTGEKGIIILTGKPVQQEVLTADGKVLSEGIIILTGRQYVPLDDVARGMGAAVRTEKGAYHIGRASCDGCVLRFRRGAGR